MKKELTHKIILILIGVFSIGLAVAGIAYNAFMLNNDFSSVFAELNNEINQKHFYVAFYTMTTICVSFFTLLFITGVQLLRGKLFWLNVLLLIIVFEVMYYFAVGSSWLHPEYGLSIGAATGVSNGGLSFQLLTLFPIWAPALALYVKFKS